MLVPEQDSISPTPNLDHTSNHIYSIDPDYVSYDIHSIQNETYATAPRKTKRTMSMKVPFTIEHIEEDFNKVLEEMSQQGWSIHSWNIIKPGLAFVIYERED